MKAEISDEVSETPTRYRKMRFQSPSEIKEKQQKGTIFHTELVKYTEISLKNQKAERSETFPNGRRVPTVHGKVQNFQGMA